MSAKIVLTVDLGYGDSGKGTIIDFLAQKYNAKLVFRYNGGAQAAHNVVTTDGRHHTFSQFGSGTFSGARTFLSRFVLVAPHTLITEAEHLEKLGIDNPLNLMHIDSRCPITTPFHGAANRIREILRNENRHGSVGLGIRETVIDIERFKERMLYFGDLADKTLLERKLRFIRTNKLLDLDKELNLKNLARHNESLAMEVDILSSDKLIDNLSKLYRDIYNRVHICENGFLKKEIEEGGFILGENAQGVLLDEKYGFFPYATPSTTTLQNAETLLQEIGHKESYRLGILRAYGVRHGPGPFVAEDFDLGQRVVDVHNVENPWQQTVRIGWFDLVATKYALAATNGVNGLAITCLDRLQKETEIKICHKYFTEEINDSSIVFNRDTNIDRQYELTEHLIKCQPVYEKLSNVEELPKYLVEKLNLPVVIRSYGVTSAHKNHITIF